MSDVKYEYYSTMDYCKLKFIDPNREIRQTHVDDLVNKINENNLLHAYPIVVNLNFEILDGQHRVKAAETLNIPIYYIISDDMDIYDVGPVNDSVQNWLKSDYSRLYNSMGNENYKVFVEFCNIYPWITLTSAIKLCSFGTENRLKSFNNGLYIVNDLDFAHKVAKACEDFRPLCKFFSVAIFVDAMRVLLSNCLYDHKRMIRKVSFQVQKLHSCTDIKSYLAMLSEIYNFKPGSTEEIMEFRSLSKTSKNYRIDRK
jgi:hypothetical protein